MEVGRSKRSEDDRHHIAQTAVSELRFCTSCGRSISMDANVCQYCGHDYRILQPSFRQEPDAEESAILYLVSVVIPLFGVVAGIYLMSRANPADQHMGRICLIIGGLMLILYAALVLGFVAVA